jgi:acyl-CoA synthetase (AMP-forming)/AMP-acid ligase II
VSGSAETEAGEWWQRAARIRQLLTAPGGLFEVAKEDVRGNRMPVFLHRHRSLQELLARSAKFDERIYLVDGEVRLSFAAHLAMVNAVASALRHDHGVRPGDRVAIYSANRWEWVVCYWAIMSLGAIPAAFNSFWTPDEFAYAASLTEPLLVLGDGPRLRQVAQAGITAPVLDLDDLGGLLEGHAGERPDVPPVDEDDPAVLIFTSGATGRPKAVTVPHRGMIGFAQVKTFGDALGRVMAGAQVHAAGKEIPVADDIALVTAPLFHSSMMKSVMLMALVKGGRFVLLPGRFDPQRVLATIERERVTHWQPLGSAGPRLASSPAVGSFDTSSVRHVGFGGAPVSPAVQQSLRRAFPSARRSLGLGYGSTEAGAVVANIIDPEFLANPTSTGRPTITTEVELRDPSGHQVPEGTDGELHARSPYIMLGYWGDPAASSEVLKDGGWLATGDIARMRDGLLYIDSRARDMMLVSAENVSPNEVEYCLEEHPDVIEAAVFAVDDDVTGDAVCAAVTVASGSATTPDDLTTWCRNQLARYKVPTRWHLLREPLPRTASGKLLKHVLRAQYGASTLRQPSADVALPRNRGTNPGGDRAVPETADRPPGKEIRLPRCSRDYFRYLK